MIGKAYLIRTVTMIQVGKLIGVYPNELVLENASWIPDTGRFNESLINGNFEEVEMFNKPIIVGRNGIIDVTEIGIEKLPKVSK